MIPRTIFSPEHDLFRDQVRRFIGAEINPYHADWEKAGIVPRSAWHAAGKLGLLCTEVPQEYGGAGGDFLFGTIMIEEMARAGARIGLSPETLRKTNPLLIGCHVNGDHGRVHRVGAPRRHWLDRLCPQGHHRDGRQARPQRRAAERRPSKQARYRGLDRAAVD